MKSISISLVLAPDKSSAFSSRRHYQVFLGPDHGFRYFKNKAVAQAFCRKVSQDLTDILFRANESYIRAFAAYRSLWFYFDNNQQGNQVKHDGEKLIGSISRTMDRVTAWGGENQSSWITRDIKMICREIADLWGLCDLVARGRSDWALSQRIRLEISAVVSLSQDLDAVLSEDPAL